MTHPKTYYRPKTLPEAIERAAQPGSIALSGGALTFGGVELPYEAVVDLQDLAELGDIKQDDEGLHIGGIVTLQQVVESRLVPEGLKCSLTRTVTLNLRNGTSVGESLMVTKRPLSEWLAALVALDAQAEHAGRLAGRDATASFWEQPLKEFIQYLFLHNHPYQGIIIEVRIPPIPPRTAFGSAFVARTPADMPIVNAAAVVTLGNHGAVSSAAIVVGGASRLPVTHIELTSLVGSPFDEGGIAAAVEHVAANLHPVGDYRGSVEYRLAMARVVVQRALIECKEKLT